MRSTTFLLECLLRAGMHDVVTVEPAPGGLAALAGIATRRDAPADRAALERLCHRLPDLLPDRPACLTHGDL